MNHRENHEQKLTKTIQSGIFMQDYDDPNMFYHQIFTEGRKILPQDLELHGYRLTARHVSIPHFKVFELLPLNSAHPAGHSFLAQGHKMHGVIIHNSFNEHKVVAGSLRGTTPGVGVSLAPKKFHSRVGKPDRATLRK